MAVEHLIGLQAAIGELGELYTVAKTYRPLRAAAERELLPQTAALGAQLRRGLRQGGVDATLVDAVARQIAGLRREWRDRLERLHASALYQQCLHAWATGAAASLTALLPELFSDLACAAVPSVLYHGVQPAAARRGPRPFLTPDDCAAKIAGYRDAGIPAEGSGTEWWDTELASLFLAADPEGLDAPLALRFATADIILPILPIVADTGGFRAYGATLRAPFTIHLKEEVEDEWWQAFDESYSAWRAQLAAALTDRGMVVL